MYRCYDVDMRVLLVKLKPRLGPIVALHRFQFLEPIELGYLAASVPRGHDVRVLDLRRACFPLATFRSTLRSDRPDIVGITGYTHEASIVKSLRIWTRRRACRCAASASCTRSKYERRERRIRAARTGARSIPPTCCGSFARSTRMSEPSRTSTATTRASFGMPDYALPCASSHCRIPRMLPVARAMHVSAAP